MSTQFTAGTMPKPDEIASAYGDPHGFISESRDRYGNTTHRLDEVAWKASILPMQAVQFPAAVSLPWGGSTSRVYVHRRLVDSLTEIISEAASTGAWKHVRNFAGCYAYRLTRGGLRLSLHSWAAALDFNAGHGPGLYQLGDEPDPSDPFVRDFVPIFQRHGWAWGGDWTRRDVMHVEAVAR